jgi:hypothetical protein
LALLQRKIYRFTSFLFSFSLYTLPVAAVRDAFPKRNCCTGDPMKKFLLILLFASVVSTMAFAKAVSLDGWVSDDRCGAKVNAACSKKCLEDGATLVFVNSDKSVIQVTNPDALKGLAGEHVKVTGNLDKGVLTVSNVQVIKGK